MAKNVSEVDFEESQSLFIELVVFSNSVSRCLFKSLLVSVFPEKVTLKQEQLHKETVKFNSVFPKINKLGISL